MKKSVVILLLVTNGMCYVSYNTLAYMHFVYYNAMQEALTISNVQLGLIGTAVGFSAIFSYFVGGAISDAFSTKKLLVWNGLFQAGLLFYFTTYPTYGIILVIMVIASFTENAIYWNAIAKFFRSQSHDNASEAKMYGYYTGLAGLGGAIFGLIGSYCISTMGSADGLAWALRIMAVYLVAATLLNIVLFKDAPAQQETEDKAKTVDDTKFQMSYFTIILKDPAFWLVALSGYCIYALSVSLSYFAPLLHANYGVSLGIVSTIAILRMYVFRVVFAPIGGLMIAKTGSLIHMLVIMIISLVITVLIAILPMNPTMLVFALIALILMATCYSLSIPAHFSPLADINIPKKMRGTALGLYAAFIFSGDTYLYLLCGVVLDKYDPIIAYKIIYWGVSGIFFVGIIALVLLMRLMKKRNAMLQVAEQQLA